MDAASSYLTASLEHAHVCLLDVRVRVELECVEEILAALSVVWIAPQPTLYHGNALVDQ